VAEVEHLKMIQVVIERMARNSFALKGWTLTLGAALLGFATNQADGTYAVLGIYVVVCFGAIDAYYLALEQGYRKLYDEARREGTSDWRLAVRAPGGGDVWRAVKSISVWPFYGLTLLVAFAIALRQL
jgi:hypothetical protein